METKARFDWQDAVKAGLVGGVVALLLSLVGMVAAFSKREIISGILSVGHALLMLTMVLAGFMAMRRFRDGQARFPLLAGGLAGLLTGTMVAVLVLVGQAVNLRAVLINASPELYQTLTFGQSLGVGLPVLVGIGILLGLLTAVVYGLPAQFQRGITLSVGALLLVGLLQDLLRVMFTNWGFIGRAFLWIFPVTGGLSIPGAIFVLVLVAGGSLLWSFLGPRLRERVNRLPPPRRRIVGWSSIGLSVVLLLLAPLILGSYPSEVLDVVGYFALMGLGLNIVVGFAGLLDLGYVAFFAIGAYTMGVLTSPEISPLARPLGFWAALPLAMLAALISGVLLGIPVLKTRGDYLAIVTLGFGEMIRLLALSDWLRPVTGGAQGIQLIPKAAVGPFAFDNPQKLYYMILAGCLLMVLVSIRLKNSRLGRAWMAVREDEDVAQAMGIELVRTKLLAFATGATFAGLSGAIFASKLGSIYPHSFSLLYSIYVLCLLIVGGMGSVPGVIVGSLLLIGLPELLREFAEYRMLVYGAALVFMMLTRPDGFLPEKRSMRVREEETS